jgi:hypothetical protein
MITLSFFTVIACFPFLSLTEFRMVDVKSTLAWASPNLKISWTPYNVIALIAPHDPHNAVLEELIGIFNRSKYS